MARKFPWVLAPVAWSPDLEFTRGRVDGLPLLSYGIAPRTLLATRRQLRTLGLRPGGADPVAVLYFRCQRAGKLVYANLYLIASAKPVRPMTPARAAALDKAMAARRTCRVCGETGWAELPKPHRTCDACLYSAGLAPDSHLHEYVTGELIALPGEVPADLPAAQLRGTATGLAPVIPLPAARRSRVDYPKVVA